MKHLLFCFAVLPFVCGTVLLSVDFARWQPDAPYTLEMAQQDLGDTTTWGDGLGTRAIVAPDNSLRVVYPIGKLGSDSGIIVPAFVPLPAPKAAFLSFWVKFPVGFDFVLEGKLNGVCGGSCPSGGTWANGKGFSARVVWRPNGQLASYVYHAECAAFDCLLFPWVGAFFKPGQWHHVGLYVQLNDPGVKNGVVRGWLDGDLRSETTQLLFASRGANFSVEQLRIESFFGGSEPQFQPLKDEQAWFRDFVVGTEFADLTQHPLPPAPAPTVVVPKGRCGPKYFNARCNPQSQWPCCSPFGWCGNTPAHCTCAGCRDERNTTIDTTPTMSDPNMCCYPCDS